MQLMHRHAGTGRSAIAGGLYAVSAVSMLVLLQVAWPSNGFAQSADEVRAKLKEAISRREKARASLQSNKKYLNENRERAGTIKAEMARLKKERAKLNADLIQTGNKVKQTEARMTAIEGRLGKIEVQERGLRRSLNAQHRSIARAAQCGFNGIARRIVREPVEANSRGIVRLQHIDVSLEPRPLA